MKRYAIAIALYALTGCLLTQPAPAPQSPSRQAQAPFKTSAPPALLIEPATPPAGFVEAPPLSVNPISNASAQTIPSIPIPDYFGVYVNVPFLGSTGKEAAIPPASYVGSSALDGVTIDASWRAIEPQANAYDWAAFDAIFLPAIAAHKKIALALLAGANTPQWLYDSPYSVDSVTFQFGNVSQGNPCKSIQNPAFWEDIFRTRYGIAAQALAAHIASIPNGTASVRIAKIAAVSGLSGELRVYNQDGTGGSAKCTPSNTPPLWNSINYRPNVALIAYEDLVTRYVGAFPGIEIAQDILLNDNGTSPPIDNLGNLLKKGTGTLLDQILAWLSSTYGKAVVIRWDDITADATNVNVTNSYSAGTAIGWQTNATGGNGGAECGTTAAPVSCTPDLYAVLLANGISQTIGSSTFPSSTLEVHATDVLQYAPQIAAASAQIRAQAK